jgi:hypothetical protein
MRSPTEMTLLTAAGFALGVSSQKTVCRVPDNAFGPTWLR